MISVIIPVYNIESYLNECLVSVVSQTYTNLEIILVDDGSTDSSGKLCDEWANKDRRIKVIHKKNGGLSSARNAGLDLATGRYVTFVDSDDLIALDMYEKMHQKMTDDVDIVACGIEQFYNDDLNKNKSFLWMNKSCKIRNTDYLTLILKHQTDNAVCCKLYRLQQIGKYRFIEGKINEDILFNIPLILNSQYVYYLSDRFYKYRIREGSITQQANPRLNDFIDNAFIVNRMINERFYNTYDKEIEGYICHEMTNFISTVEKYQSNTFDKYVDKYKKYVWKLDNFFNPFWSIGKKIKYILVTSAPDLYRFLLKIKR